MAAVLYAAGHSPARKLEAPEVVFRMAAAPAPPPPPPLGGAAVAHTEPRKKPVHVNPDTYVPVSTAKQVKEPEPAPERRVRVEPGGQLGGVPAAKSAAPSAV